MTRAEQALATLRRGHRRRPLTQAPGAALIADHQNPSPAAPAKALNRTK